MRAVGPHADHIRRRRSNELDGEINLRNWAQFSGPTVLSSQAPAFRQESVKAFFMAEGAEAGGQ